MRAQVGEPTVVRLRAGQSQYRIHVARQSEASTERHAGAALDGIGVGEHHFTSNAIAVEFEVATVGIPTTAQGFFVLFEPLLGVVLVAYTKARAGLEYGGALAEELVELRMHLLREIGAVVLGGQASVAVGRDDDVGAIGVSCHEYIPSGERGQPGTARR